MQPLFMVLFTWNILSICFLMLMFQMRMVRYFIFMMRAFYKHLMNNFVVTR